MLNKLFLIFKHNKSEFLVGILIFDIKYKYLKIPNKNLFNLFNNQVNYVLTHYFVELRTTKYNIDKFFFNPLMKFIIKKLL